MAVPAAAEDVSLKILSVSEVTPNVNVEFKGTALVGALLNALVTAVEVVSDELDSEP